MGTTDYTEFLNQKSQKFYSDLSKTQTIQDEKIDDLSEKIELKVSIAEFKNDCTYHIQLFNVINNQKLKLNQYNGCSNSDNNTLILNSPIIIRYFFEKEQKLFIEISKTENGLTKKYEVTTTLGCVMGSRKNTFLKNISTSEPEMIVLKAEKLKKSEELISIKFEVNSNDNIEFDDVKNKLYYEIFSNRNIIYRSEI